jgi:hypothetical protein
MKTVKDGDKVYRFNSRGYGIYDVYEQRPSQIGGYSFIHIDIIQIDGIATSKKLLNALEYSELARELRIYSHS